LLPVVDALPPFEPFEDEPLSLEVEPPLESEPRSEPESEPESEDELAPDDDDPPSESFVDAAPDEAFARLSVA
jgi:hypothetical protein